MRSLLIALSLLAAGASNFKEIGSPDAPIVLEIYTDYQCPHCRAFYTEVMPAFMRDYVATGKVRIVHRDFPLPAHAFARIAARYANAAGQLGRYELVANQIFQTQDAWSQNGNVDAEVAKVLPPGEMQKVRDLVRNDAHLDDTVAADVAMGQKDKLAATPWVEVVHKGNRQNIGGFVPLTVLKSYIDQLLAKG